MTESPHHPDHQHGADDVGTARTRPRDAAERNPEDLSMRERMVAGLPYRGGEPRREDDPVRESDEAARLAARYQRLDLEDHEAAREVLDELLGSLGRSTRVRPPLHVDYGQNLHFGDRCFVNFGLTALDVCPIRVGDDVQFGPHVQLLCATHPLNPLDRRRYWEAGLPITIEDNVWLGGGAVVLGGVTVGHDAVVAAGAVVTRDVPPGTVVAGVPARVVKTIDPQERSGQFRLEAFPAAYQEQVLAEGGTAPAGAAEEQKPQEAPANPPGGAEAAESGPRGTRTATPDRHTDRAPQDGAA